MGQQMCQNPAERPSLAKQSSAVDVNLPPLSSELVSSPPSHINRLASSRLQLRTSSIHRNHTSYLKQAVRSRLNQLPPMPSILHNPDIDSSEKVYLSELKGYYQGDLYGSSPQGSGVLYFDNGDYYQGEFHDGRCEGRGRFVMANRNWYEGDFRNGMADGYGKYIDKNGYRYEGQWKNNLPNGRGQAIYPNESRYNGEFLNNKRHGRGTLMQEGSIFEGVFVEGRLNGSGTMQNDNGESYVGGWRENLKYGEGVYTWPNGNRYEGNYKEDKRDGYGTMYYSNGEYYKGYWKDGVKHGEGMYQTKTYAIKGVWEMGQLTIEIEKVN